MVTPVMQKRYIEITGTRENNLKNVSLKIPKQKITVFTGVSGAGKSSIVFDTIAAESQRQLNEMFSAFIRNRMPKYGQPDVDSIKNLSTTVIIDQKPTTGLHMADLERLLSMINHLVDERHPGPTA